MFRNLSTFGLPLSGRPSELIELALSFGFDGMDVDILDLQKQAEIYGLEHARRLMVSARLKGGCFQLPVRLDATDKEFEADLAELPDRLKLAAAADCPRAVATLAPASEEHSFKDFFELHRVRLRTVGDLLDTHGITLGLAIRPESAARADLPHPFIHTFEGLLGLVAASPARIGAVVDAWALHVTGEPVGMIASVPAGRIVEIRLSDAPRDTPGDALTAVDRLMPGETGVIAGGAILQAAASAGFDGPATPWAARSTLAGRGREKIVRLAGDRMEQAWRDAGLEIPPRWFAPVARDQFGRPIDEAEVIGVPVATAGRAEGADA